MSARVSRKGDGQTSEGRALLNSRSGYSKLPRDTCSVDFSFRIDLGSLVR